MAKYLITTDPAQCTGCLRCQLVCSERYTKAFNPSAARIRVDMRGSECDISFTADCTRCGLCINQCLYGALRGIREETVS